MSPDLAEFVQNLLILYIPAELAGGLVEPGLDVTLPILVEMGVGDHLVPFRRHGGVLGLKDNFIVLSRFQRDRQKFWGEEE